MQGILDQADISASDCFLGKQNQIPFVWKSRSVYHIVLCDRIKTRMTYDDYKRLVQAATEAKMREKEYYQELVLDKVENIHEYAIIFKGKKAIVR